MNFKIPSFYKRILAFFVVIGPIFWLVFTDDGQRRTDIVLLTLWGEDEIALNLKALDNQVSEEDLKQVFPDITWTCEDELSNFGNRLCASRIGIFNDIPAHYVTIFFLDRWINGVKIGYRGQYHEILKQQLWQQLGAPANSNPQIPTIQGMESVLHWVTDSGNVILKDSLQEDDEAALLWLSLSIIPN
ncbi:MAG: hypothetical protein B6D77_15135 [gamma proteobacterium symbiont of Ctena orbiculata]|uniref:hypothetical protein n=1 Tax=Candidatus Thiodiazotropha sp. CDECU1 TaxID=3065865 RepID=UPI000D568EF1|nr:hypothetical protein [Candidatus Thiodiazotropha sp. CDECU1]PVV06790.1 MAG: hypothetical protein B6D77_15135 [gamma proteobacterium symbiont of Ctena orbiculata]PVV21968.1 MAG: hypothetical protein B6D78_06300 [gamma proteobacterium symbiont of Ctena orbiculata]PVV27526.1 MAG: hypothetical protein B6D79_01970 [gamma proteobacterium symbiont of Ctena orbiculata]